MLLLLAIMALACGAEESPEQSSAAEATSETESAEREAAEAEVAEAAEDEGETNEATPPGDHTYGAGVSDSLELTPLTTLAENAEAMAGQTVKTEGEITQVCQRMGCWMEMQAEGVAPVRVPMANHSFFLPRDVGGRQVTVEGILAIRELGDAEREHLESEGAQATANAIEINATGVVVH